MLKQIPNILTYTRIFSVPLILVLMMWPSSVVMSRAAATLFILASVTDFFDGYLARKFNSQTVVGRFLDPIADKLLVTAVIVILVYQDKAALIPAIAIICREIFVSGLREFLIEIRVSIPVSNLAKVKTFLQLTALPILIIGNTGLDNQYTNLIGNIILWVAAVLTIFTGFIYFKAGLKHISSESK